MHLQGPAARLRLQAGYPRARMSGPHLSRLQGQGIEFDEVRLYQPGDDVRAMDWRVTARTGKPHTKLFREERERPAMLLLDLRPSMFFATRGALKAVIAAECAALLGWSVTNQGDRVGCMLFDGSDNHRMLKPARGKRPVMRMLGMLLDHPFWQQRPEPADPTITPLLQRAEHVTPAGSMMIIVSDGRGIDADAELMLTRMLRHHSVLFIRIYDPFEAALPEAGLLTASDGVRRFLIDSGQERVRVEHRRRFEAREVQLDRLERHPGFVRIDCTTMDDPQSLLTERLGRHK